MTFLLSKITIIALTLSAFPDFVHLCFDPLLINIYVIETKYEKRTGVVIVQVCEDLCSNKRTSSGTDKIVTAN